jgi:ribonuclease T2
MSARLDRFLDFGDHPHIGAEASGGKRQMRGPLLALLLAGPVAAQDIAGDFDYYVMALSWQPNWCAHDGRGSDQCDVPRGWTLHGLWPQHEAGWPRDCAAIVRDPSRRETAAMEDIMGSGGLAWYQWKKHGRCAGLDPADYFAAARRAYAAVERPEVLRRLSEPVELPAEVVEAAFLRANPRLTDAGVRVTCKAGYVHEIRVCLTRDLVPRDCGVDVRTDCDVADAVLLPID